MKKATKRVVPKKAPKKPAPKAKPGKVSVLDLRLTEKEHRTYTKAAAKLNMTLSAWLRMAAHAEIKWIKPKPLRRPPPPEVKSVARAASVTTTDVLLTIAGKPPSMDVHDKVWGAMAGLKAPWVFEQHQIAENKAKQAAIAEEAETVELAPRPSYVANLLAQNRAARGLAENPESDAPPADADTKSDTDLS